MDLCFTSVSESAGFWSTYLQSEPWEERPQYYFLEGFRTDMIVPDLLHVLNLGVSRDVCGGILKTLISGNIVFAGSTIPEKLAAATASLRSFARQRSLPLRFKKVSKKRLCWDSYAEFKGSGYDLYVVAIWLESIVRPYSHIYADFSTLLWSLNAAMSILYSADWYLSEATRREVKTLGEVFMRTYLKQASMAVANHDFMWRCKPKLHLLHHIFMNKRSVNPAKYATWLDEDFLKRISKTLRLVNSTTAQQRCLQRWLLALPYHLQKSMSE